MKKFPTVKPDFELTKKHRKLLKLVRESILSGHRNYICTALTDAHKKFASEGVSVEIEVGDLHRYVHLAIECCAYFHSWQRQVKKLDRNDDQSREDRIKWLTYLLENC